MINEAQSFKVKSCNSCHRPLPLFYFGVYLRSGDGYSKCCKDCRNYRRRKSYSKTSDHEPCIFPLVEHNSKLLSNLEWSNKEIVLNGLSLSDLEKVEVKLIQMEDKIHFYILRNEVEKLSATIRGERSEMIDLIGQILRHGSVRLFLTLDVHSMTIWGARK